MKGIVTYVSKSGKSAILAVTQTKGLIKQRTSGFVETNETLEVGQEVDLSMFSSISSEKRAIDGREFDFLILK